MLRHWRELWYGRAGMWWGTPGNDNGWADNFSTSQQTTDYIESTASDEHCAACNNSRWLCMVVGFRWLADHVIVVWNGNRAVRKNCKTRSPMAERWARWKNQMMAVDCNDQMLVPVTDADYVCTSLTFGISFMWKLMWPLLDIGEQPRCS